MMMVVVLATANATKMAAALDTNEAGRQAERQRGLWCAESECLCLLMLLVHTIS